MRYASPHYDYLVHIVLRPSPLRRESREYIARREKLIGKPVRPILKCYAEWVIPRFHLTRPLAEGPVCLPGP